jgi:hypothetical protein
VPGALGDYAQLLRHLSGSGLDLPIEDRDLLRNTVLWGPDDKESLFHRFRVAGPKGNIPKWEREVYLEMVSIFSQMPWANDAGLGQALLRAAGMQHATAPSVVRDLLRHPAMGDASRYAALEMPVAVSGARHAMAADPRVHGNAACRALLGRSQDAVVLGWALIGAESQAEFDAVWLRVVALSPAHALNVVAGMGPEHAWMSAIHLTPLLESSEPEVRFSAMLAASRFSADSPAMVAPRRR